MGLMVLVACRRESGPVDSDTQPIVESQSQPTVDQTWEPVTKQAGALPLRNMPVPDEILIAEMEAADMGGQHDSTQPGASKSRSPELRPEQPSSARSPERDIEGN
jgi:hypothetical protein